MGYPGSLQLRRGFDSDRGLAGSYRTGDEDRRYEADHPLSASLALYASNLVEVEFSEVRIHDPGYPPHRAVAYTGLSNFTWRRRAMGKKTKARRRRMTMPLLVLLVWAVCAVLVAFVLGIAVFSMWWFVE
jgi:hypothetical protein